jgi:hypothetical protein
MTKSGHGEDARARPANTGLEISACMHRHEYRVQERTPIDPGDDRDRSHSGAPRRVELLARAFEMVTTPEIRSEERVRARGS